MRSGRPSRSELGDEIRRGELEMRECIPTRDESRALAKDHALIPVYREEQKHFAKVLL